MLRDLSNRNKSVHVLYFDSGLAYEFVYGTLKKVCNASMDYILEVRSSSTFHEMLNMSGGIPMGAERWLFIIQYTSVKGLLKKNNWVLSESGCCFLVVVKNYKEMLEFREEYGKHNELYYGSMGKADLGWIFKGFDISSTLLNYVGRTYYKDTEKIFLLKEKLDNGVDVKKTSDIFKICGVGSGSLESFIFTLLKSDNLGKKAFNNRIHSGLAIAESLGVNTFKNFFRSSLKNIIDLKILYLNGIIYDTINNLPDKYDKNRYKRYVRFIPDIKEVSYEKMLLLYSMIDDQERWLSVNDYLNFMYKFGKVHVVR